MTRRLLALLLLAFVLAACRATPVDSVEEKPTSTSAPATTTTTQPTTTTTEQVFHVSGRISESEGKPVARAVVRMGAEMATTGPDGWFSFDTTSPSVMTVTRPGWSTTEVDWDPSVSFFEAAITPLTIRGIRVGGDAAASDAMFESLLRLADTTAVNAFVFDTKQEGGTVLYESSVPQVAAIGSQLNIYDPTPRIEQAHQHGLYAITRIVTFEDGYWTAAHPDEKLTGSWVDPSGVKAREYNLALAVEACEIGFDEIQFDYIRFPSGSTATNTGQLDMTQDERVGIIASFLSEARRVLNPLGCAVSADVFGIVASTLNDQGLGQRPEELSAELDALSPMVYPSHYSDGWLGFADPNDHPYDVTSDAISDALPRMAPESQLRPWLQAFWWTDAQIRRSIQAAEDAGVGWILWNIRSNFNPAALPTDDEVTG